MRLDFGIAKILDEIGFTTRKDIVAGTLLYMSPEQAQSAPLTPRSDICALGLMMFEAVIGKHPTLLILSVAGMRAPELPSARSAPLEAAARVDTPRSQILQANTAATEGIRRAHRE